MNLTFTHTGRKEGRSKTESVIREVALIMEKHGIMLSVHGCGCCGSPDVLVSYEGKLYEFGETSFEMDV